VRAKALKLPGDPVYAELKKGSGKQNVATTMAFVRLLKDLIKDENIGARFVPIAPDEYRTFGMDSLFPTSKIYAPHGQTYEGVDRKLLLAYKESQQGQMLHEGISEAGSMASTIAAGTSYATHGEHMIPVYIFYSMFGFQRTGDQMWALGDQMGRGFLLGATAGRTTLTGEGLQHADGHSPLIAATNPACVHYDPTWAFELAHIVQDALRRMYGSSEEHPQGEDVFYYLTVYNEPYQQPAEPEGLDVQGLLKGLYRLRPAPETENGQAPRAQILASGVAGRWALEAQRLLAEEWGVAADVWSATSWNELAREAQACDEWNLLHPDAEQRVPYVTSALENASGPIVSVPSEE
jgi:pyruvate dehydrogenase E1 component